MIGGSFEGALLYSPRLVCQRRDASIASDSARFHAKSAIAAVSSSARRAHGESAHARILRSLAARISIEHERLGDEEEIEFQIERPREK